MEGQRLSVVEEVRTDSLRPGDLIEGSAQWEVMIPSGGLYVDRTEECQDKNCRCTLIYFRGKEHPEGFNSYWIWYVRRKENDNG